MKKSQIISYTTIILLLLFSSCKSEDNISFCDINREFKETVIDKTAKIVYLSDKKVYALKFYPNFPSIDEVTFCVICDKPNNIDIDDAVRFTGKLYLFNLNENFTPTVGGTNYYYTEIQQIEKITF